MQIQAWLAMHRHPALCKPSMLDACADTVKVEHLRGQPSVA